jgi:hypothetical protein
VVEDIVVEVDCSSGWSVTLKFIFEVVSEDVVSIEIVVVVCSVSFDEAKASKAESSTSRFCIVKSIDSLQSVSFVQINVSSIFFMYTILIDIRNNSNEKNIAAKC